MILFCYRIKIKGHGRDVEESRDFYQYVFLTYIKDIFVMNYYDTYVNKERRFL